MLENRTIVCVSTADWDNPYWVNQQQIMSRLAGANTIIYIESQGLRPPSATPRDLSRILRKVRRWLGGAKEAQKGLFVVSPIVLPWASNPLINRLNQTLLKFQIKSLLRRLGLSLDLLWCYNPNGVDLIDALRPKTTVYHCVDEITANPHIPTEPFQTNEKRLLSRADLSLFSAKGLFEKKGPKARRAAYLPNVADFEMFHQALTRDFPRPKDLLETGRPIAGYFGAIAGYKMDFPLLKNVAESRPEVEFVLIGQVGEGDPDTDLSVFEKIPNIHFLGGRPRETLPAYLKYFDVCILPSALNDYTKNMFPMKFFEFLAAGKPVVTTPLPALENYYDLCYLGVSSDEFSTKLLEALKEKDAPKVELRLKTAREHSWEARMEEIYYLIKEVDIADK